MIGTLLGGYRILSELGAGGMGCVYLAESADRAAAVKPGVRVALKTVHPHLVANDAFAMRFLREGEMGRRVEHPNVVRTLDVGAAEIDGRTIRFLVMEYVEGQTLLGLLEDMGTLPEDLCRHLGASIARGLEAIHAAGIVHRDLKPENVLVTADQQVKIMDLGVARISDELIRLSVSGAFVGSPRYASPEQFRGGSRKVEAAADLYAVGLILHELATGQHPLAGDDFPSIMRRALNDPPPRAGATNPQISPFLEELLLALLEKDPADRPASAALVAEVLETGEEAEWWNDRARTVRERSAEPLRRVRIPRETAVYGRDAERALLDDAWGRVLAGEGQVVLLEGEAGIGKTRLVDDFVERMRADGTAIHFLFGSWPPGGAATSIGALTTAFREHFGEGRLDTVLAEVLDAAPLLAPGFAALLRGEPPPAGALPLAKDALQIAFGLATAHLAADRPLVLLADDLHFAPDEGRELFAALAHHAPGHRVLVIGTTRPGISGAWRSDLERLPQVTARVVERLMADDLAALLGDALDSPHLGRELARRIESKSGGNPFFVFEIIRGLREGQFLRQTDAGNWETGSVIRNITVPDSVAELLRARLEDLAPEERDLLDIAACFGFEFDAGVLADALDEKRIPLLRRLASIEREHRLIRSQGRLFVFEHHTFREVLYDDMPEALREEYHAVLAGTLERRESAADRDPATLPGPIAHALCEQFMKGGRPRDAVRYLEAALDHLEAVYLNDHAVELTARALAEPGLLAGERRVTVLVRHAKRLDYLGRRDEQRAALDEAVATADALGTAGPRALARSRLGGFLAARGGLADAIELLEEALPLAEEAGDRGVEAVTHTNLGIALRLIGRMDAAARHLERAAALAHATGDHRAEGAAQGALGTTRLAQGDPEAAWRAYEASRDLARTAGNRRGEALALGNLANLHYLEGRYDEARQRYEEELAIARATGDRRVEATVLGNLGLLASSMGRTADALELLRRTIGVIGETGFRTGLPYAHENLLRVLLDLGATEEAAVHADRITTLADEVGPPRFRALARLRHATVAAARGDAEGALTHLENARTLFAARNDARGLAETALETGRILLAGDRNAEAAAAFEQALEQADGARALPFTVLALALRARLPGGDAAAAVEAFDKHRRRLTNRERLAGRWALWQATGDREHLEKAAGHLAHLRANAPDGYHESLVRQVPLHRAVHDALERTRHA